jgi:hypothetical protein
VEWLAVVGLGIFHGLNPAMGWLFAVALGLQEGSRRSVLRALPSIGVGHLLSVALVAVIASVSASVVHRQVFVSGGAALLIGFGGWRLLSRRHFRWVGMRLSPLELMWWSFLMSSLHGAGLMLLPVLADGGAGDHHGLGVGGSAVGGLAVAGVHGAVMVATMGVAAVVVYDVLGLSVLRRAWVNLDSVWALALVGTGAASLLLRA